MPSTPTSAAMILRTRIMAEANRAARRSGCISRYSQMRTLHESHFEHPAGMGSEQTGQRVSMGRPGTWDIGQGTVPDARGVGMGPP